MRFQDLFHSPPGVLFTFPSRYLFSIGRLRVFSLGGWSPHLQTGFLVSRSTFRKLSSVLGISYTGLSPSMAILSRMFSYSQYYILQAFPISLATTLGISVDFFSCSYLDVSVRCVRLFNLCIRLKMTHLSRVSPFGHLRIIAYCQLPEAFRRLSRPSSPVIAKASTTCTYSLDPITSMSYSLQVLLV